MTNVLPKDSLKAVRRFYVARVVFVGSLVGIACGMVALLALVPAYAIVTAEDDSTSGLPEVALSEMSADREGIVRAQSLVRQLKPFATSSVPTTELVREVLEARGERIRVERIDIRRGTSGSISVSGTMTSRDDINAYRAALTENARFEKVSVPLGILTGAAETRFTVTITGSF